MHTTLLSSDFALPVVLAAGLLLFSCSGRIEMPDGWVAPTQPPVSLEDGPPTPLEPPTDPGDTVSSSPEPTQATLPLQIGQFTSANACSACHTRQAQQWALSSHSRAMTDPVFQALTDRATEEDEANQGFCLSCHSNIGTATRAIDPDNPFSPAVPVAMEGVTCESCHRLAQSNASQPELIELSSTRPIQGGLSAGAVTGPHLTEQSRVLGRPELCATCHEVESPTGVVLEQPYGEWSTSPAKQEGRTCLDCHMPLAGYGTVADSIPNTAERRLRNHSFLGPGMLTVPGIEEQPLGAELPHLVVESLRESTALQLHTVAADPRDSVLTVAMSVSNQILGHKFPTGSVFFRQVWIRLTIEDSVGDTIFQLLEPEQLSNAGHPEYSQLLLSARLFDEFGQVTPYPWRAHQLETDRPLQPGESRPLSLHIEIPTGVQHPVKVRAQLLFRTYPISLIDELGLDPEEHVVTLLLHESELVAELD